MPPLRSSLPGTSVACAWLCSWRYDTGPAPDRVLSLGLSWSGYGVHPLGDVRARSWVVISTLGSSCSSKNLALNACQVGVGISITRA